MNRKMLGYGLLIVASVIALGSASFAGNEQLRRDQDKITSSLATLVCDAESMTKTDSDLGLCKGRYCLFGKFMREGDWACNTEYLSANKLYVFLIECGDLDTKISITVKDESGKVVKEDSCSAGFAGVTFISPQDSKYSVTIKLVEGKSEQFCSLIMLEENGVKYDKNDLTNAIAHYCALMNESIKDEKSAEFRVSRLSSFWSIMGCAANQGESIRINGLRFAAGRYFTQLVSNDWDDKMALNVYESGGVTKNQEGRVGFSADWICPTEESAGNAYTFESSLKVAAGPRFLVAGMWEKLSQ